MYDQTSSAKKAKVTARDTAGDTAGDTAEATATGALSDRDLRVPFFCEENAWRLAYRHLHGPGSAQNKATWEDYHVVFVSNEQRCVPFFRQRARSNNPGEHVFWDYHVFVIRNRERIGYQQTTSLEVEVLDVDTWLPFPCLVGEYLEESFPYAKNAKLDPRYLPIFRVIPATQHLLHFYSDRMHMVKDGKWSAPPPKYQPILNGLSSLNIQSNEHDTKAATCSGSNLEMYISMTSDLAEDTQSNYKVLVDERRGTVFTLEQFRDRFISFGG